MTFGRATYVVCQWLLLVAITRLAGAKTLGEFTYALAVASPIVILAQLNMRAYMVTDAQEEFSFADYWKTRVLMAVTACLLIALVAVTQDLTRSGVAVLIIVGLYKAIESISDIYHGALQKADRMRSISLSVAAHGAIALLTLTLVVWQTGSLALGVAGIAAAWIAILIAYDRPQALAVIGDLTNERSPVATVIRACFPFGLILALMSVRLNTPAYFVKDQLGLESVAFYSAVAYFMVAGNLVSGSLVQTSAARLAGHYQRNEKTEFRRLFLKLAAACGALAVIGIGVAALAGPAILNIAYGGDFAEYSDLLVLVMLAGSAGYFAQITGMNLTIARLHRPQLLSNACGAACVALVSYLLIPNIGVNGGAIALLAGNAIIVAFNLVSMRGMNWENA